MSTWSLRSSTPTRRSICGCVPTASKRNTPPCRKKERAVGDLSGVPKVYVHRKCGPATGMPEEIIRTYLKNPYMYMADQTFCCGCSKHVPLRECVWTETGEDLQTYTDKLRAAKPEMKPKGCHPLAVLFLLVLVGGGAAIWFMTQW